MRLGQVIGRVTLNQHEPSYTAGRFLVVLPLTRGQIGGAPLQPLPKGNSLVVYDRLGASVGDTIGYSEGGEAAAPFTEPTPVDAFNAAIIDDIFFTPANPGEPNS